jgi:hypothetical protein
MNITVITTFGSKQYAEYAKRMVETFVQYWDKSINLVIYTDVVLPDLPPNVVTADFPSWFAPWRTRHVGDPDACGRDRARNRAQCEYDFRRDCLRFSFKIGALTGAPVTDSILIWMDADIMTFRPVDRNWLKDVICLENSWMSWIDRKNLYPECGFRAFDFSKVHTLRFIKELQSIYESDNVFKLAQTHDSYVIQKIVSLGNWPKPASLNKPQWLTVHHPFPLIPLGKRLDHLKGKRKVLGASPERKQ